MGRSFGYESCLSLGESLFLDHCVRGSVVFLLRDVVKILCIFSFLFFLRYIVLVQEVL